MDKKKANTAWHVAVVIVSILSNVVLRAVNALNQQRVTMISASVWLLSL